MMTLKRNKFFCAKIERVFFTNSVKVDVCSTSNTGEGVRPILVAPATSFHYCWAVIPAFCLYYLHWVVIHRA